MYNPFTFPDEESNYLLDKLKGIDSIEDLNKFKEDLEKNKYKYFEDEAAKNIKIMYRDCYKTYKNVYFSTGFSWSKKDPSPADITGYIKTCCIYEISLKRLEYCSKEDASELPHVNKYTISRGTMTSNRHVDIKVKRDIYFTARDLKYTLGHPITREEFCDMISDLLKFLTINI